MENVPGPHIFKSPKPSHSHNLQVGASRDHLDVSDAEKGAYCIAIESPIKS